MILAVINARLPTLIVDSGRTVRFADTHADNTARTEVVDILAAFRRSARN